MKIMEVEPYKVIDETILENTLVGLGSLKSICRLANVVRSLEGCIAEVGVYRGGSALLLKKLFPTEEIYLFDTFEGIPHTSSFDNFHIKRDFSDTSDQSVKHLLGGQSCRIYKGVFPKDTGKVIETKKFKLVHLDVDVYKSYKDSLSFFYPRMVEGGGYYFG